jgi:O-antigen/teichoic acid export membrane protein
MFKKLRIFKDQVVSPPHKRLVDGVFWSLFGNLGSQFIGFLITIVLARYWGKVGFGEYGLIVSTVTFFGEFAGIGLGITATKYLSQHLTSDKPFVEKLIGTLLLIGSACAVIFSFLFYFFAHGISLNYLNSPGLVNEVRFSSIILLFGVINGIMTSILFGFEKFKEITIVTMIRSVVSVPLTILAVYWWGLPGAVFSLIVLSIVVFALQSRVLKKVIDESSLMISWKIDFGTIKRIYIFGISLFIANIFVGIALWVSNVIVAHQISGIGEVGIINVANQWRGVLTLLPSVIVQVLLPVLSANLNEGQKKDYDSILNLSLNIVILGIFPFSVLLMLFSSSVISLYGSTFAGGSVALIGIILSCMLAGLGSVFGPVLQSRERILTAFLLNFSWSLLVIGSVYFFGNRYGASSYTYGSAFSYLVVSFVFFYLYVREHVSRQMYFRMVFSILNACLIALLCLLHLYYNNVLVTIGIIIYSGLSIYFTIESQTRKGLILVIMTILKNKSL